MSGRLQLGRGRVLSLLVALVLVAAGCGAQPQGGGGTSAAADGSAPVSSDPADPSSPPSLPSSVPPGADGREDGPSAGPATDPSADRVQPAATPDLPSGIVPARISIPAIGVEADVIDLDLRGAEPEVPEDFAQTGWYTQTRLPGEIGPAVIAGHIDSVNGPAVFSRLDELVEGDEIEVVDDAGEARVFVVTRGGQYPKGDLPREVFGFEPEVELRLITCGGVFDRSSGHYRDNYVVYAKLRPDPT